MKNRMEEYQNMVDELNQPPKELAGSVERARRRARRTQLLHRITAPISSMAATAACFVLMVNLFPTFALACSGVPIVRELAAAAAFSPSLSAAVAHDYVQYIGQSQTVDGVKVELGYAIVDRYQAVFFYSVDGGRFYTSPDLTDKNGEGIGGYATSTARSDGNENSLDSMTLSFGGKTVLPEQFTMKLYFVPDQRPGTVSADAPCKAPSEATENWTEAETADDWTDPRTDPNALCFTFDIRLDPNRIAQPINVLVDRWLELDGQRILVDRLEYTPTRTVLYLDENSANTAWLRSLNFWFEDEKGNRYDNHDGILSASGTENSKSYLTYYFQSFYYDPPKGLTLCVDSAVWLEKDAPHVLLDLSHGQAAGLPDGMQVGNITHSSDGKTVIASIVSPLSYLGISQPFDHTYWDPEGSEHTFNQWGSGTEFDDDGQETGSYTLVYFENYPWDTAELELSYTSVSEYSEPVRVPITAE